MKSQIKICLILLCFCQEAIAILPVSYWQKRFDAEANRSKCRELSNSSYSLDYYDLSYALDAYSAMFEATKDSKYLDSALLYVNNVISKARDIELQPSQPFYKDSYLGWISFSGGVEVEHYESYFFRYVTKLLRIIKQTPELYKDFKYYDSYTDILKFVEKNIWEKWWSRGKGDFYKNGEVSEWYENIYKIRTHLVANWAYIALDLYEISSDKNKQRQYLEVFSTFNAYMKSQLHYNPNFVDAYLWNQTWDRFGTYKYEPVSYIQDVSHANNVISYIVEAYDNCSVWSKQDLEGFKNTLVFVLWNTKKKAPFDNVDGTDPTVSNGGTDKGEGRFHSDGWVKLGRYYLKAQEFYECHEKTFSKSVPLQFYANMTLNASVLNSRIHCECSGSHTRSRSIVILALLFLVIIAYRIAHFDQ